jgi:hypothetical protein
VQVVQAQLSGQLYGTMASSLPAPDIHAIVLTCNHDTSTSLMSRDTVPCPCHDPTFISLQCPPKVMLHTRMHKAHCIDDPHPFHCRIKCALQSDPLCMLIREHVTPCGIMWGASLQGGGGTWFSNQEEGQYGC